jgi:hypothetical protein
MMLSGPSKDVPFHCGFRNGGAAELQWMAATCGRFPRAHGALCGERL